MPNVIAITQRFEQFVAMHGDDPFISRTVTKMFSTRLSQLQKELKALQSTLSRFERNYGKTSDTFLLEYQSGKAGDEMDFIEWSALVKMRDRLLTERAVLQGQ